MSFESWLSKQDKRKDNVGLLAQDWKFDGKPKMEILVGRLKSSWAEEAFKNALQEYFDLLHKEFSEFLKKVDSTELSEEVWILLEKIQVAANNLTSKHLEFMDDN